jgi:hypothetical protein
MGNKSVAMILQGRMLAIIGEGRHAEFVVGVSRLTKTRIDVYMFLRT